MRSILDDLHSVDGLVMKKCVCTSWCASRNPSASNVSCQTCNSLPVRRMMECGEDVSCGVSVMFMSPHRNMCFSRSMVRRDLTSLRRWLALSPPEVR